MRTGDKLEMEIAALCDLPREVLAERWTQIYECPPPKGMRVELLVRAAAWHLQAKRLGGPSAQSRRLLKAATAEAEMKVMSMHDRTLGRSAAVPTTPERTTAKPVQQFGVGTRLIREWNGGTHMVDVAESGYLFDGKTYRSLSAIARKITGAHWSGPRFFGRRVCRP